MRYRLAALSLFVVLPVMNVLAAPAPDPSAILDIGPPPKGETAEQYRKRLIEGQTFHGTLCKWWSDPEVRKLRVIAPMEDPRPWLAKNLRVTEEREVRRIRLTFRAGTRDEQVVILNALLRVDLFWQESDIPWGEECLRNYEKNILELEQRIKSSRNPREAASYQKDIDDLRTIHIPELRAAIAREKLYVVVKWAK